MDMPKLSVPSAQYLLNLVIGIVLVFAVVKYLVPETYKSWFRV
jgi:hypothetical protein